MIDVHKQCVYFETKLITAKLFIIKTLLFWEKCRWRES